MTTDVHVSILPPEAVPTIHVTLEDDGAGGVDVAGSTDSTPTIEVLDIGIIGPRGAPGVPGPVGDQGPEGPPGPLGGYVHYQDVPAVTWIIPHGLGLFPSVTTVDSAGTMMVGDVQFVDPNTVFVHFGKPFGGRAYLS